MGGQSDWFYIDTGVCQGCILLPLLFALAIDLMPRAATPECGIQWTNGMKLSEVDIIDDRH